MMKKSFRYPTKVEYNGKYYPINTSYIVGLKCLQLSEDTTVSDKERAVGILVMLFGRYTPLNEYMMNKAILYLQRGSTTEEQVSRVHDIDIIKDLPYIATSIQTQYPINIRNEDIHFWYFIDLIEGLEGTLINRIRDIRNAETKDIKDLKQRNQLIELKNHYSLTGNTVVKQKSLKELYAEIEEVNNNG